MRMPGRSARKLESSSVNGARRARVDERRTVAMKGLSSLRLPGRMATCQVGPAASARLYTPSCQSTTGCPSWPGAFPDRARLRCSWSNLARRSGWHLQQCRCAATAHRAAPLPLEDLHRRAPGHHPIHLIEKLALARLLRRQVLAQAELVRGSYAFGQSWNQIMQGTGLFCRPSFDDAPSVIYRFA